MGTSSNSERTATDRDGNKYTLGNKLDSGAEGTVYDIVDEQAAAKVFDSPADREQKIIEMVENPPKSGGKHDFFTWPEATLYRNNTFVGYVMPKLNPEKYTNIRETEEKLSENAGITKEKLRVAANLAAAVHLIHSQGHAVGDFNFNNIWVNEQQKVTFLDCDSFSITGGSGEVYHGNTKGQEVQAPEGRPKSAIEHTQQADNFCLAFRIFGLMVGNYPYQARGRVSEVGRVADIVDEHPFTFWYSKEGILQPTNEDVYRDLPHSFRLLFESAFMAGKYHIFKRPSAKVWWATLVEELDTITGDNNSDRITFSTLKSQSSGLAVEDARSPKQFQSPRPQNIDFEGSVGDSITTSGTIHWKGHVGEFEKDGEKRFYLPVDLGDRENANSDSTLRLKFWNGLALRAHRSLAKGPEVEVTGTLRTGFRDNIDYELSVSSFEVSETTDYCESHNSILNPDAEQSSVHIRGTILYIDEPERWERDDGSEGCCVDCIIADPEGLYTVSFYNSNGERMAAAQIGQTVEITEGIVERTSPRPYLIYKGAFNPPTLTDNTVDWNLDVAKIDYLTMLDHHGEKETVDLYGKVVQTSGVTEIDDNSKVQNFVLEDPTGKVKIALWNQYIFDNIKEGDLLLLLNMQLVDRGYTDLNDGLQAESKYSTNKFDNGFKEETKIVKVK